MLGDRPSCLWIKGIREEKSWVIPHSKLNIFRSDANVFTENSTDDEIDEGFT